MLKRFLLQFWPVIFILFTWFIFSSPYFLQNKVPYPSKYQVTFFSPWSYYPEFAGPVKNNAMPDVVDQIYPWKYFTVQSLKSGQLPLWNPYNFAGNPHIANFQSAVFSPFNLLFFIIPFVDAWSIMILIQSLIAGVFVYLFMREISVSKTGSLIASISFMFCGFMVVWMAYGTLSLAITFLPLALLAINKVFNKRSFLFLPLIAISIFCSYFSGHIQTSIYLTVFVFLFIIFKFISTKDTRSTLLSVFFFFVGLIVAAVQVIPTLQLYEHSVRSNLIYQGGQIPLQYLVTLFAPDFYGNPVTRNDWVGSYAEWASFIGIIPFLLAIFAFTRTKHKYNYFFVFTGILALLFSSETPFRQLLAASNIPVFATSIPSRMIVLFSFSFSILAGFGFDHLLKLFKDKAAKHILIRLFIVGFLLIIIWVLLLIFHTLPADKTSLAIRNLILPSLIFFVATAAIIFFTFYSKKKAPIIIGLLLVSFTAFDSLRFVTKWMPFDDRSLVYPEVKVIQEIKANIGNSRVFGNLGTQVESYYGIQSLEGYDPLYIGRYGEFIRSSVIGSYLNAERSVVRLDRRGKYTERVLDLLGVTVIFHPKSDTFTEWAFPVWADKGKYTVIYEDEKFQLYKNNAALPRATLFYEYEVIKDDKKLLARFFAEDFDFKKILLLHEDPSFKTTEKKEDGSAKIVSYSPNKITIETYTTIPALLFLSDAYYPNWKVRVNSKEEKILLADYAFRAVKVPPGRSTVEFEFTGLF